MKHVLITGAADGIGRALARRFAAAGWRVTGLDRDAARAAQTAAEIRDAGGTVRFVLANLADAASLDALPAQLAADGPIDVLIHNAGISAVGPFARSELAQQQAVLTVNLEVPLLLTAALLRQGQLGAGGTVVFISSLSHFVSYPGAAVYAASKDGLAAYARSLAAARRDLHVLTVFPGPTRTAHARRYSPDNRNEHRRMAPERLADEIFRAVGRRRRRLIPGVANRLLAILGTLAPWLTAWLMRKTLLDKLEAAQQSPQPPPAPPDR